ncbi:diguanylate cyclase (GGDEF) domain-containing protein [Idiomarina sp. A28L]|uniref:EAL domain-containing protein n=1 Tax=Idiomarina sp. A28L TaxID=1036674 RepID=UPI0002138A77|nr:EAL domain-containing protein [Idiomarina sp. A28L]EGN75886.1 diguanylate cyclase (GGDEF) domain-containing protein [Idiomarina sp. A28L]
MNTFESLVKSYQQRLLAYSDELEQLAEGTSLWSCSNILEIKHIAHRLSGSGRAYNFPEISRIAKQLEIYCELLEQSPDPKNIQQLQHIPFADIIKQLANELENAGQAVTDKGANRHASQVAPKQQKPLDNNSIKLLLIDDDNEFSALLSKALKQYGYQTHFLTDISQLTDAIEHLRPDAILVDMDFYGERFAGARHVNLWRERSGYPLPTIFISSHNNFDVRLAAVKAGGHHFLKKPIDMTRLSALLRKELGITELESPFRILLVDDDEHLLQLYQTVLSQDDYTIFTATSAEQALCLLKNENPELILIDIFMPECSGLELGRLIRQHEEYFDTAILFMSSSSDTDVQLASARLSQDEFISKPIEPWRLRMAIRARAEHIRRHKDIQLTFDGIEIATFDRLTALPLLKSLEQRLDSLLQKEQREGALLKLDIRNFHTINNLHGPYRGDGLLQAIAWRLSEAIADRGAIYRATADEFYVLIDQCNSSAEIKECIETIHACFIEKYNFDGEQSISITADFGVILFSPQVTKVTDMLAHAETALFQAKSQTAASTVYFDASMRTWEEKRFNLAQELELAFLNQEFNAFYQPIFSVHEQKVVGFEALVRWQHPTRGLVGPGEFIPALENSGHITKLTVFMLERALMQLAQWQKQQPDLFMSINLSALDIESPRFLDVLSKALKRHDVNPQTVVLEITETTLLANWQQASKVIQSIKSMAVKLALDDFGTGFSSLNYLGRIDAEKLKIDRSFIDGWSRSGDARLLSAMIQLGKSMGMTVVAEGVEQQKELLFLQELQCDYYQGFLSAKPMLPAAIETQFL